VTPQPPEQGPEGQGDDREPVDLRPYLCIPYWSAPRFAGDTPDSGQLRPLPGDVVSWLCPGIHASPYTPGAKLEVTVDVRNSGRGNAAVVASVVVYWVDPTVGFSKPTLLGATVASVPPRGGRATTPTVSGVIPATAPDHICLVALVTHPLDNPGTVIDPVGDRHWAQLNLVRVKAAAGIPVQLAFLAVNPFAHEAIFEIDVHRMEMDVLKQLALSLKAEPSDVRVHVRLLDDRAGHERDAAARLALDAGGRRVFNLTVDVAGELAPEQMTAVEVVLRSDERREPVGSLGVVIQGAER